LLTYMFLKNNGINNVPHTDAQRLLEQLALLA